MSKHDAAQSEGLSFLMEAATALAKLPTSPPPAAVASPANSAVQLSQRPPSVVGPLCSNQPKSPPPSHEPVVVSVGDTSKPEVDPLSADAGEKEIFPARLMAILNDSSLTEVITWLPHGRSFIVLRPDIFTENVLPKYFPPVDARGSTPKYASFTRKVNRWGFRQALRGPDTGAFFHPLFRRDKPDLCLEMVCQRARDRKKKGSNLPAKKRHVALLTKESLDAMDQQQEVEETTAVVTSLLESKISVNNVHATVSVADDTRSTLSNTTTSSLKPAPNVPTFSLPILNPTSGISLNTELVRRAVAKRNEEERIRVAKVMLYHAFMQASREVDL